MKIFAVRVRCLTTCSPVGQRQMIEPTVAQPHRNRLASDVAQRARRDHSPHISRLPRQVSPLVFAAALGLGCAAAAARPDGGSKDSSARDAAAACADDCAASGLSCSFNRCTSMACAKSEANSQSVAGCLFYTLQADNVTADEAATTSFLVANPGPDAANVALQAAQPATSGSTWSTLAGTQMQILAGASARLPVSGLSVKGVGVSLKAALRISSDRPVTVAEIESDDVESVATSSGGTMILPLQSLGKSYLAVTYPQESTGDVQQTAGSLGGAARVIVVGTQDATQVTFTPAGPVTGAPGGDLAAGDPYTFTLDDGDVFQIYSGASGEDLTGASVIALGAPVAVFSGNISTSYGSSVTGINSADMAHEQMPPISSWSTSYVAAALTPQASIDCTSFFGPGGGSIWRVLASTDTRVTVTGPGIPSSTVALVAGAAETIVQAGSFTVTAPDPILVTQGIDCEPSLSLAVAVGAMNLFTSLPLAVPPGFDLQLGIVRMSGMKVYLDNKAIAEGMFEGLGNGFDVATVALDPCVPTDGSGVCTHLLQSAGFGVTLRGMDVGSSFALTPPLLAGCDGEVCINSPD
jgi:IgGFc binding protein